MNLRARILRQTRRHYALDVSLLIFPKSRAVALHFGVLNCGNMIASAGVWLALDFSDPFSFATWRAVF